MSGTAELFLPFVVPLISLSFILCCQEGLVCNLPGKTAVVVFVVVVWPKAIAQRWGSC